MLKGSINIFTGEGKGKTTAALGTAMKAAGEGKKVFIGQFLKNKAYSEINTIKKHFNSIKIEQFGTGDFINGKPTQKEIKAAQKGLERIREIITGKEYDLVILDEANIAISFGLFSVSELLAIIFKKSNETDIIITGRNAAGPIIQHADNVTEMVPRKHYFQKGVEARVGIEK
jgi:cob(I)alamin adenosyltransferase